MNLKLWIFLKMKIPLFSRNPIFYPSHARIPFYVIKFKNPFIRFYSIKPIPSYHYTVSHFLPLNTWSLHIYLKSLNGSENTDLGLGSYCYYIVYWWNQFCRLEGCESQICPFLQLQGYGLINSARWINTQIYHSRWANSV